MGKEIIEGRELSEEELNKIKREGLIRALPYCVVMVLFLLFLIWSWAGILYRGDYASVPVINLLATLIGAVVVGLGLFLKTGGNVR